MSALSLRRENAVSGASDVMKVLVRGARHSVHPNFTNSRATATVDLNISNIAGFSFATMLKSSSRCRA
jgi:hypothetical protein